MVIDEEIIKFIIEIAGDLNGSSRSLHDQCGITLFGFVALPYGYQVQFSGPLTENNAAGAMLKLISHNKQFTEQEKETLMKLSDKLCEKS